MQVTSFFGVHLENLMIDGTQYDGSSSLVFRVGDLKITRPLPSHIESAILIPDQILKLAKNKQ